MLSFDYTIKDELGIHARPAGLLAKLAKTVDSEVTITKGEKTVNMTKLMALMSLGVKCGEMITVSVSGGDEVSSLETVKKFIEENL